MDLMKGHLSEELLAGLGQQFGAQPEQTASATEGILHTLMGALAKNTSTPDGANALSSALERDHDGSVLGDLMGLITGGGGQASSAPALNGAGILSHILGAKQDGAANMIGQASGLDAGTVMSMMVKLAPVVMGMLGKTKQDSGLDASGLASLLGGHVQTQQAQNPAMGMIGKFLDQDQDGSYMDDLAGMGMKLLGGMFRK